MAVEAVLCDIHFSTNEPPGVIIVEIPLKYLIPSLAPQEMTGDITPESFGVFNTFPVC